MRTVGFYQGIVKLIGLLFIFLFVYTATDKLINLAQFQSQLEKFPFISSYSAWLAVVVPLIEFGVAGLFLLNKYVLTALYYSLSLMVLFTAYIIFVLNFSDSIPCSCGGIISSLGWSTHIILNLVFMGLAGLGIYLKRKKQ